MKTKFYTTILFSTALVALITISLRFAKDELQPRSVTNYEGLILAQALPVEDIVVKEVKQTISREESIIESVAKAVVSEPEVVKPSASPNISNDIKLIVDVSSNMRYGKRNKALGKLARKLSQEELDAFVSFLKGNQKIERMNRSQINVLKNDMMTYLIKYHRKDVVLEETFTAMAQDENQHEVVRDYAIQHLVEHYKYGQDKDAILNTLMTAAEYKETVIAGAAILGMSNILQNNPNLSRKQLTDLVTKRLAASDTPDSLKASMLQVSVENKSIDNNFNLVDVFNETDSYVLKLSTLSTMGANMSENYKQFLKAIAEGEDTYLKNAALKALNKNPI